MAGVTFKELIAYVGISADELNKPCSDEHVTSVSLFLANWQTVAPLLGLTETDEEDVEEEGRKTQDKRYRTLRRWKNKNLFKATYRVLVDVFLKLGRADLAEKVCRLLVDEGSKLTSEQLSPQHPPHQPGPSSPPPAKRCRTDILQPKEHTIQTCDFQQTHQTPGVQTSAFGAYASYLKSVYTQKKLPVYDKCPHVKSKKYINLALIEKENITRPEADQYTRATIHGDIDDILKSKQAMNISQIAQLPDGSQPKCILVEGAPGVGKSTFACELCRKWGKGKLLQQYQLVVLLSLRDESVQAAKKISDLFQYRDHQIQQAAVEEIQSTGGKGLLLLFEGYDELPEELRSESSVFLDIITGRELPGATFLITSRPWASEFLRRECKRHISQHIEILGFTKIYIQSYLESTIPDNPSLLADLKKYISCYPHINSMMYIPLYSAIVIEVYRNSRKDKSLVPKTMTELYSSLVRSLLLRHLLDHPVHGKKRRWRVCSFDDLPQDVYQQLCKLGRIAYEGIIHGQQVIFSDLPEDFETLGLMQCTPKQYADEGAAVSYNFLHLTVQEYLAAFHLSQQPVEEQIKHFREYKQEKYYYKQHHFHMVLQFLSGLRKFNEYPSNLLNAVCVEKSGDGSGGIVNEITFIVLHWLFEAQDNDFTLLQSSGFQLHELDGDEVTPFDCFVLGYCVSRSNCTWRINLSGCNIGDEKVVMLVRGAVEAETHLIGKISEIHLSINDITSKGLRHLLRFPKQLINQLETMNFSVNKLDSESCAVLAHLIPHVPHLKVLGLCINPNIGQGGTVPLMTSLTAHSSLERLGLYKTRIVVKDCQALGELLSSSTSLKELDISGNDLPPKAIELIISGVHHNNTLKVLVMSHSHFSPENTISLASVLSTNYTLVNLNLGHCNIDSDGACKLASALCMNDALQELYLEGNPIGVKGATAFAEMLHKNKSLKELNLQDDYIGEEGTQKLINSLTHNTTIKQLYLPTKYNSSRVSYS